MNFAGDCSEAFAELFDQQVFYDEPMFKFCENYTPYGIKVKTFGNIMTIKFQTREIESSFSGTYNYASCGGMYQARNNFKIIELFCENA